MVIGTDCICSYKSNYHTITITVIYRGGSRGRRTRRAPPLKLEKIWFFGVKSWFFTRKTPKFSRLPLLGANFLSAPPLTWNPGSAPDISNKLYIYVGPFFHRTSIIIMEPTSDDQNYIFNRKNIMTSVFGFGTKERNLWSIYEKGGNHWARHIISSFNTMRAVLLIGRKYKKTRNKDLKSYGSTWFQWRWCFVDDNSHPSFLLLL